jgi:6-phosphogluconolactonase
MRVYVGTYTGPGKAEGIYVFDMDESSGALTPTQTVSGVDSPSFLALHPNRRYLYAVNESGDGDGGPAVTAFSVDSATGHLTKLNRQPSHGTSPCYVSLDPDGKCVLVANYGNGIVSVYPVQSDGALGDATCVIQHEGSSAHQRQAGPHAHSIRMDPSGKYVLSCDLGCDRIFVYTLDAGAGKLTPNTIPYGQVSSGAGPRHIAFHPNGRLAFVNNEIDSTVTSFTWDAERGALRVNDTRSTLPADFTGRNSTAQIAVHPNGNVVYVSNRGHDSIATFGVDAERGTLTPLGHTPTQGKTPRNFNLDPSGAFLYAANQNSNTIVTFRVDANTGRLTPTNHTTEVPAPVCVLFAP